MRARDRPGIDPGLLDFLAEQPYRRYHEEFPWVLQKHVSLRREQEAAKAAASAAREAEAASEAAAAEAKAAAAAAMVRASPIQRSRWLRGSITAAMSFSEPSPGVRAGVSAVVESRDLHDLLDRAQPIPLIIDRKASIEADERGV